MSRGSSFECSIESRVNEKFLSLGAIKCDTLDSSE